MAVPRAQEPTLPAGRPLRSPARPHRRGPATRPSPAARRFGYLVAIAITLVLLGLIHVSPGWRAVPFLTEATTQVLPLVSAQLWISIAVNVVWIAADPRWLRALGDVVTAAVGLAATARVLGVFPFAFEDSSFPWATTVRVVLLVGVVGSAIGVLVNLVRFVQAVAAASDPSER